MGLKQSQHIQTKQLDSYSMLICSKYFATSKDYTNLICVCSKFKETTEKFRFNPIPIKSLKLFPKIQTQHLYSSADKKLEGIDNYEIWYKMKYDEYLQLKEKNIRCHDVIYTEENRNEYGNEIPTGVTALGSNSFSTINIKSVVIPSCITSIKPFCFYDCRNLECVKLTNRLSKLDDDCFSCCTSLKSLHIPSSIQSLGNYCLSFCSSITTITIPDSITSIGFGCFNQCASLESIKLPPSISVLENNTFVFVYR